MKNSISEFFDGDESIRAQFKRRRESSWAKKPALLFPHIPKTAGSTLDLVMHRQYDHSMVFLVDGRYPKHSIERFTSLPTATRERILCVSGHFPFGVHECMTRPVIYTTFLRDPVKRLFSLYHHVLREQTHYMHETVVSRKMSLLDFAGSNLSTEIHNDQTRRLSGQGDVDQVADRTNVDEALFRIAKSNIETFFPVVGLTEAFDESLLLMKEEYSWNYVFYHRRKVSNSHSPNGQIDSRTQEVIEERNQFDIRLYDFATQRLRDQIDGKGRRFHDRLRLFRKMNKMYNILRKLKTVPPLSVFWRAILKVRTE